jgi:MFS family permease
LLAVAAALVTAFAFVERGAGMHALVPRDVMRNPSFTATCLAILLMSATFFAALLYLPQFMQKQLDYSPLKAGTGMLPFLAVFALVSFIAGRLYNRIGAKLIVSAGALCIAAGPLLFAQIDGGSGYLAVVPGMVLVGAGIGLFYSTATTAAVTAVGEERTSLAGGIIYMFQIAGGAIGLGLTTTVFSSADSFVQGLQNAFLLDGLLALGGFAVTVLFVGGRLRLRQPAPAAAD